MHNLKNIAKLFDMRADFVNAHPYGSGHINDTYLAYYDQAGLRVRYIHQRINSHVFKEPVKLMENIARVTDHALAKLLKEENPEARRRTLTCIKTEEGNPYAFDAEGSCWRTYPFIERARTYDIIETTLQAEMAAKAFGDFQNLAADIQGERLHETIEGFHHTKNRYRRLLEVYDAVDPQGRRQKIQPELDFISERETDCSKIVDLIESGEIPERITHNDTKLNNVMLDDVTSEGVCVIDLDTTMPGSVLYDFGDMVRTATPTVREDSTDLDKMDVRMEMYEALIKGYLSSARSFLTPSEIQHLAFAGKLLPLENAIRFLTDYLEGDVYFKIHHPEHNIERCRSQIALVKAVENRMSEMENLVQTYI